MTPQRIILACIISVILLTGLYMFVKESSPVSDFSQRTSSYNSSQVRVGSHTFRARIADTENKRVRGLSGVTTMDQNEALVFVFPAPQIAGFWMKDMLFSIDIVCVRDNRVIDSVQDFAPTTYPEVYTSTEVVDMCIEFVAGTIKKHAIKVGDEIHMK